MRALVSLSNSMFTLDQNRCDQNRSYYPVQSRRSVKCQIWKYIFYFLLDVAIINAWVLRNKCLGNIGTFCGRKTVGRPRIRPVAVNVDHQYVELVPGSKGKQCKNNQRKRKREKAANREGKRPRESRFGCGRCNIVLCKGDCWLEWHSQPFEDL